MPLVRVAQLSALIVPSDYARNEQHHAATEILPPPPRRRPSADHRWPLSVRASTDQALRREGRGAAEQARLRGQAAAEARETTADPWSLAALRVTRELPALREQAQPRRAGSFLVTRRAASAGVSLSRVATGSLRLQVPRDHVCGGMRTAAEVQQPQPRGSGVSVSGVATRVSDGSARCVAARESFSHRLGLCSTM